MSIKNDLKNFADGIPKEHILKPLIESDTLDLLVIGGTKDNYEYKILWEVLKVYCSCYERNIKLRFAGEFRADESLKRIISFYELDNNVEFICEADKETQLSYYLGSDFALFLGKYDEKDETLLRAQYFYLPILVINADEEAKKRNGVLQLSSNPAEIAAALRVLKNNSDYRRKLGTDSREKIYDMEE